MKIVIKVLVSIIPTILGTYFSIKEYKTALEHPEWSAPPEVAWIKLIIGIIISIVLWFILVKRKHTP